MKDSIVDICYLFIDNHQEHRSVSNNSRGGSPLKEVLPHSPTHHSATSANSQGHSGARGVSTSNVMVSPSKAVSSPHHKEAANNLAKSDLNLVSKNTDF